jgi:hypothetical protein
MGIFVFPLPGGLYLKVQPAGGKHKGKWYMKINGIQDRIPQAYPESLEENDLRNSALKLAARSGGVVTLDMIMDQMMTFKKRIRGHVPPLETRRRMWHPTLVVSHVAVVRITCGGGTYVAPDARGDCWRYHDEYRASWAFVSRVGMGGRGGCVAVFICWLRCMALSLWIDYLVGFFREPKTGSMC